jgi:hypothetical protein
MGISILRDRDDSHAVLYCNTTDWAFGPVHISEWQCASDELWLFYEWLPGDPREYSDSDLEDKHAEFCGLLKYCERCEFPFLGTCDCEEDDGQQ